MKKRVLAVLLTAATCFSIAACGKDDSRRDRDDEEVIESEETTEESTEESSEVVLVDETELTEVSEETIVETTETTEEAAEDPAFSCAGRDSRRARKSAPQDSMKRETASRSGSSGI